jgi:hypothetical protein
VYTLDLSGVWHFDGTSWAQVTVAQSTAMLRALGGVDADHVYIGTYFGDTLFALGK